MLSLIVSDIQPLWEVTKILDYAASDSTQRSEALRVLHRPRPGLSQEEQTRFTQKLLNVYKLADQIYQENSELLALYALAEPHGTGVNSLMSESLAACSRPRFAELSEAEFYYTLTQHILTYKEEPPLNFHQVDYEKEAVRDPWRLVAAVEESLFSSDAKLEILSFVRRIPEVFPKLAAIYQRLEDAFIKILPDFAPAEADFRARLEDKETQNAILALVKKFLDSDQFTEEYPDPCLHLQPSISPVSYASLIINHNLFFQPRLIISLSALDEMLAKTQANSRIQPSEVLFKVLGDPSRWRIMQLLAERRCAVKELVEELGSSSGTVSHHLNQLLAAELLTLSVEGRYNYYRVNSTTLRQLAAELNQLADRAR